MKIATITGVTKTQELTVTKSIGSIIISSGLALGQLTTEKITIYIERGNGSNVILANKVLLKDFILASTYGTEATQSDSNNGFIALCEIADEGSVYLAEKESIKIVLEDLDEDMRYDLHGIEEPVSTNNLYFFEQKTVASEEFNKKIDVQGFDLAIMTVDATVSDLSYQYSNGQVVKYLPFELQTLSRDIDPIQALSQNGTVVQGLIDRLTLPLVGVVGLEINKSQGYVINFVVRALKTV
ncbi:hypothetical protein D0817_19265 [Flavobacterium cupreum]|uniref:Uncharacterized protein n=2 Tax=Flavobacterium TaxID=237 RepID=A0A4Y7U9Y2_9FLAO|nr:MULTISPECIES: hypothetical protein [Flavobacterium]RUT68757.1 hypothetical protein D0817_19265 [Flavobacterium cupreum]TCN55497.1 hypothetical protein EV142_106186 [Flavobacterium circumlabens]TEB43094.1 hypothetical protein D0809_16805 [Flavobacterium circumlabens]